MKRFLKQMQFFVTNTDMILNISANKKMQMKVMIQKLGVVIILVSGLSFSSFRSCQQNHPLNFSFLCPPVFILTHRQAVGILLFNSQALWQDNK